MNTDPELKQRLSRAADPLEVDVESRLRSLHGAATRRRLVHKAGVIAVAASVAVFGAVAAMRLAPGSKVPSFGPAGPSTPQGQIAFFRDVEKGTSSQIDLFTVSAAGTSDPTAIDTGPQNAALERWSPDGSQIAYLEGDAMTPYPYYSIVVANADGSDPRTIVHGQYFWLSWSPDGAQIAYSGETLDVNNQTVKQQGLWVVNADGTDPQLILDGNWESVDWSPDGSRLLLSGYPSSAPDTNVNNDLYTVTPQGNDLTQLTNDAPFEHAASWSPDGMSILFGTSPTSDDADHEMNVAVANSDGTDIRVLTDWSGFDGFPVWSPDGGSIAFASDRDATPAQIEANATSGAYAGFSIYTMQVDGSGVSKVVDGGDAALLPSSWKA